MNREVWVLEKDGLPGRIGQARRPWSYGRPSIRAYGTQGTAAAAAKLIRLAGVEVVRYVPADMWDELRRWLEEVGDEAAPAVAKMDELEREAEGGRRLTMDAMRSVVDTMPLSRPFQALVKPQLVPPQGSPEHGGQAAD